MTPERQDRINFVMNNRQNDVTVILENIEDPHNISAVLRSCDAIGIFKIYVLNTKISKHKKFGNRSSSSANKWVFTEQFDNAPDCIKEVRKNFDYILCSHLSENKQDLYTLDLTKKIAFAFGNETSGVSDELKNLCDGTFVIPQVGMIKSLNISVACAVTLYEAFRQKRIYQHYNKLKISENEVNSFLKI